MNTMNKPEKKRFYILSVDLVQSVFLIWFVSGHTCLWWDSTLDTQFPNLPFIINVFLILSFIVPPGFLFLYSFNTVNSLLRKNTAEDRKRSRSRLLKRGTIFFFIAEFAELSAALINSPQFILNSLLTWELFHQFAFSTFFLLVVFEIAWSIEKHKNWCYQKICIIELIVCFVFILLLFLLFHDYTQDLRIDTLFVELELNSIIQKAVFENGQAPIIPYLLFPIFGGIFALFLDFPNKNRGSINRNAGVLTIIGVSFLAIGFFMWTNIEKYVSPVIQYPISSPVVFISLGAMSLIMLLLIYLIDINTLYTRKTISKYFVPFILVSKITLTVYFLHNVGYVIPSNLPIIQSVISDVNIALVVGFLYSVFFVLVAIVWKKWKFKYSFEWIIWKLQNSK